MNINKFTQKSIQAVNDLEKIAYEYGNQEIEQEHLLYALMNQEDSLIKKLIEKMNRQPNGIRFAEAAKVLDHFGYEFVRQKGSHAHFMNGKGELITIKVENPLKKYILWTY